MIYSKLLMMADIFKTEVYILLFPDDVISIEKVGYIGTIKVVLVTLGPVRM